MLTHLLSILSHHLSPSDTLIVGVSGGPDSTALLNILISYKLQATSYKLIVAHINHGIRGAEADRDEKFVRDLVKSYNAKYKVAPFGRVNEVASLRLGLEVKRVKLAGKTGLEERGRKIRREFFEKLRVKYSARWILTAHTEDDQLETIVFNFLRGSGPAGLTGMKIADGFYLKPFLTTPKSEILAYLKSRKLIFRVDSMNNDTRLRRVFIRKKILPLLANMNPAFRKTLLRNREIFGSLEHWTEEEAKRFLREQRPVKGLFSRKDFLKLPKALQYVVIEESYRCETAQSYRLPFSKVEEILALVIKGIGNKRIECGAGNEFILKKGVLFFSRRSV